MGVFVIAEAGSSHDNDLQKAYRLIEAAKECGADAVKFQWTSDPYAMAKRRGMDDFQAAACGYSTYLQKPVEWLHQLKAHADKVGIEWMCTVYLKQDIATIAPLVRRFKVSAYEEDWPDFVRAHYKYKSKPVIVSQNLHNGPGAICPPREGGEWHLLYCVSKYPTPIEELGLSIISEYDGLSDHTANVLTGAAAVAAGARIVEAHIRSIATSGDNPDYDHSLVADCGFPRPSGRIPFEEYVQNIRTVERML